jgi:hypothetical protein
MSEAPTADQPDEPVEGDEVRQHSQQPAEGPDEETERNGDAPRVHSEDPAEG